MFGRPNGALNAPIWGLLRIVGPTLLSRAPLQETLANMNHYNTSASTLVLTCFVYMLRPKPQDFIRTFLPRKARVDAATPIWKAVRLQGVGGLSAQTCAELRRLVYACCMYACCMYACCMHDVYMNVCMHACKHGCEPTNQGRVIF